MMYRLHREGTWYLLISLLFFVLALGLFFVFTSILTIVVLGLSLFLLILFLIFFRNPLRAHGTKDTGLILAPADGKVVVIEQTTENEFLKTEAIQVSIFMSPLNVHSNKSPVTGEVVYQQYHPGAYLVAWHPKSSELNERNTIVIRRKQSQILIRQIAGMVARKIVWYTRVGAKLSRGEEFGFIKFGSRVDMFLPLNCDILVKIGDTVKGGITDIAQFNAAGRE